VSRFTRGGFITERASCWRRLDALQRAGREQQEVDVMHVPGALELRGGEKMRRRGKYDG